MNMAVAWPAVILQAGVDELVFIADEAALASAAVDYRLQLGGDEQLLDARGRSFLLIPGVDSSVELRPLEPGLTLDDFIMRIRRHAACAESCCVEKFNASSFAEAIQAVAAMSLE